jgi:mono/diheme cytochrome c family protein
MEMTNATTRYASLVALLLALSASAGTQSASTPQAPGADAQNGRKLFTSYGCYECHGTVGQGGAGPRIAPPTISLSALRGYLRQPSGQMPPYTAKVAADSELADIYEYLKSIPPPTTSASIRLLNQ